MGFSRGPKIVTDDLEFVLDAGNTKSYSGTGTSVTDITRNGNNGILTNGTSFLSSDNGVFDFDGTNDTINLSHDLRKSWSYEVWVKLDAISGFAFLGQGPTTTRQGLHIWIYNTTPTLRFGMYSNDTDFTVSTSTGIWYHYVFTYNHNSPYTKQLYRNGVEINGNTIQTQQSYLGTGTLRIGATYSSGGSYANGKMSGIKLYNRILTASEILQNYNAQKSRFGL